MTYSYNTTLPGKTIVSNFKQSAHLHYVDYFLLTGPLHRSQNFLQHTHMQLLLNVCSSLTISPAKIKPSHNFYSCSLQSNAMPRPFLPIFLPASPQEHNYQTAVLLLQYRLAVQCSFKQSFYRQKAKWLGEQINLLRDSQHRFGFSIKLSQQPVYITWVLMKHSKMAVMSLPSATFTYSVCLWSLLPRTTNESWRAVIPIPVLDGCFPDNAIKYALASICSKRKETIAGDYQLLKSGSMFPWVPDKTSLLLLLLPSGYQQGWCLLLQPTV